MDRVYEWYIKYIDGERYAMKGIIESNGKGESIRTDWIKAALYDKENELIILTDESGRMYTIYVDDMYIGRRCFPPQEWVDNIHKDREDSVRRFCTHFGFEELADKMISAKNEKIKELEEKCRQLRQTLPENTLYLALRDRGQNFRYGVYNVDGKTGNCEIRSGGTFDDAVYVYSPEEKSISTLAIFFPYSKGSVIFDNGYSKILSKHIRIDEGELLGYLYNSGVGTLDITFSWRKKITLKPGEEI